MRIEVIGTDDSATPQARAYAEYRLFATLARHNPVIRSVRVMLAHAKRNGGGDGVTCVVELVLEPAGSVRTRAQGPHAYGAIDRAAKRIGDLMARRTIQSMSS
jgi:ribosome-associated translation inhibitor RaiA